MAVLERSIRAQISAIFESLGGTFNSVSKQVIHRGAQRGKMPVRAGMSIRKSGIAHNVIHRISTLESAFCANYPQSYPQRGLPDSNTNYKLVSITEYAKRPSAGTRRPLLIHTLATTNGGTVPESTDGRETAAVTHLNLIRTNPANAAHFVRLAYVYGVTVPRIAAESGLPVTTVQSMVLGGDIQ